MTFKVASEWFERASLSDGITHIWEPHVPALLRCNIWHVRGRDSDLVIDTGMGIASLREFARDILDRPATAIATHTHIDHIGGHHEFDCCLVHSSELDGLRLCSGDFTLADADFDPLEMRSLRFPSVPGYEIEGPIIEAVPSPDFDLRAYKLRPASKVRPVEDGDIIDLGDRHFEVMHLPGHSPGSIGLLERATGTLFSGDTLYDGPLIDVLHHSSIPDYARSLKRLLDTPIQIVHAGHDPSFGRERLIELATQQLDHWGA
ncbi:MBL fold metallo-hydrolase [Novosphingobium sp. G106]|uniref:MBL fold metallo-hydrolase n=1 Tax=Novosphingobium sp. G106 TaxID=2849500 RepID=UPI001C2CCE85|nr:MBL fold metallo-hydrolase [Novosphingobium sp. G106]MBV1688551.1 MBL fold metallo-hydrolase [Novosphingobium sp. G106]